MCNISCLCHGTRANDALKNNIQQSKVSNINGGKNRTESTVKLYENNEIIK